MPNFFDIHLELRLNLVYNILDTYIIRGSFVLSKQYSDFDNNSSAEQQLAYAARVREILFNKFGKKPNAFIHTYGCQQNVSDSERLQGILYEMGYNFCDSPEEANLVIFNTCAVREHAEARVFGNVGQLKKLKQENPDMIIALCGCMVQQEHIAEKIKKSYPYVDIVFGTHVRHRFAEFVYRKLTKKKRVFEISSDTNEIIEGMPIKRDGTYKAWLPIMHGCNNFCTYCIVPYVRGRERSRKSQDILAEAKQLIKDGVKEITLLGQNVNSYGKGLEEEINFSKLLRMINAIKGDFRIRFMTSHPRDCTKELIDTMAECEKICHHLHLPVQCGSNEILKRMNRHYNIEQYMELIEYAKEKMPDIELTSDIIVGFPGETYEDFKKTVEVVKRVKYNSLFTFIFSPRKGTPAAVMEDIIPASDKSKWFRELLVAQEEVSEEINKSLVGKTVTVLCENSERTDNMLSGKTNGYATVDFRGEESLIGKFVKLKITEYNGVLIGKII